MIKIAHVSDIHVENTIKNTDSFEQLYEKLREEKLIFVNTGDTFHTKLDMRKQSMMSELFVGLADIAPYQ